MPEVTARLGLPLLVAGQGQKDITHNEALAAIDALLHASVRSRSLASPPADPDLGACWLVPVNATDAWTGKAGRIACWTEGGWRFLAVPGGGTVHVEDEALMVQLQGDSWIVQAPRNYPASPVAEPQGGALIDAEARTAIAAILARLRQLGLLSAE